MGTKWNVGSFGSLFLGSSRDSGESGLYFHEEVFIVAVSVGHSLDDLDLVVEAFEKTCIDAPPGVRDDALPVWEQAFGEAYQRLDG